jgi:hypothetical protein
MSYRNPQQYVDTTTAKSFQNLQQTIAGSFAGVAQSYAQAAERRRKENEKKEEENKKTIKGINKEVSNLRRTLNITDDKYKDTDWAEVYNPLIKEYEDLSNSIEFGTSENPSADRIRRDEIYASVAGLENSIANVASYVDGMDDKIMNADKQGGLYTGMDSNTFKGLSIFSQKLPGKRQPRFVDGNVKKLVWDIYDEDDNLIQTFDAEKLQRIGTDLDELVITIPNQAEANKASKLEIGTVFETKNGVNGEYFSGKIKSSYLDDGKIIDKQVAANGAVQYTTVRQVNKYSENGIIFNEEFNTVIDASIDGMLQTNKDNTSAIAFNNSQFKDITFDIEDFVNNPYFKGKYTKENLPEEIKAALKDKDGFQFDLNDPLTDVEKDIFRVAYKKHYLDTEVPNEVPGLTSNVSERQLDTENLTSYLKNQYNPKKHLTKKNKSGVNASAYVQSLKNDERIDPAVRETIIPINALTLDRVKAEAKVLYINDNEIEGELTPTQQAELDLNIKETIKQFKDGENKGKAWDTKDRVAITYDQVIDRISKRQKKLLDVTNKNKAIVY